MYIENIYKKLSIYRCIKIYKANVDGSCLGLEDYFLKHYY